MRPDQYNKPLILLASVIVATLSAVPCHSQQGAVINDAGIPVKIITIRDCKLFRAPDESSDSAPCRVFTYWYVLPPDAATQSRRLRNLSSITQNGFYRVSAGDTEGEFKGWIRQSDAVEWHHRQAVNFGPRRQRGLASFFEDDQSAVQALHTGDVSAAKYREPERMASDLVLMPLLDSKEVEVDGIKTQLHKVAFVAAPAGATMPQSGNTPLTVTQVLSEATTDIVFVLDSTHSMRPTIAQVQRSISTAVRELASNPRLRNRIRLGLVAYRDTREDAGADFQYLTQVFCTLDEGSAHEVFLNRLRGVRVAPSGAGDYPEDVLAGVHAAMSPHLGWNDTSWRVILIVGDSSVKEPNHPTPESRANDKGRTIAGIKTAAQPSTGSAKTRANSFVISAVLVEDQRYAYHSTIARRQFRELTSGRSYRGDFIRARGGSDPEDFSGQLTSAFEKMFENFEHLLSTGRGVRTTTQNDDPHFPVPLVDLISVLPNGSEEGHVDLNFAESYCTEFDSDGNRQFVPHVFVRRGQLESFNYVLRFLHGQLEDAGDPGSRDVNAIVRNLQIISTSLNLSEPITAEMDISKLLRVLIGLPLKTPIFRMTIQDLAAMNDADYNDWVTNMKACTDTLDELIDNPVIWHKLHPTAKDREYHAFVPMSDLP